MAVLAALLALFVALNAQTDFATQLADLQAHKALWLSNGVTDYHYRQFNSCFCSECELVGKYIIVNVKSSTKDGIVTWVKIDSADPLLIGASFTCDVQTPLVDNYFNVEYYFNISIEFVQERIDAGCDFGASTDPLIDCAGSVTMTYDDTLHYPTSINIEFSACGAACDEFIQYNIGCLTALNEDVTIPPSYNNTCEDLPPGNRGMFPRYIDK